MTGPVAQLVALTCHGNAFLRGDAVPRFFPSNSTCQFCDRVAFVQEVRLLPGARRKIEVATNPDEWFAYLKQRDGRGIWVWREAQNDPRFPDKMTAGYVDGGGTWKIEILLPKERSEFWQARWEVWNQKAPDRRIWRVTYRRVARARSKPSASPTLGAVEERFLQALREIQAFSQRLDCGVFTDYFSQAIDVLHGVDRHGYHTDLSPPSLLSVQALAVLDAAQFAWVFGGMGSWNDMWFDGEDGKEYERVSEQLFQALTEAICVAANTVSGRVEPDGQANGSQPTRG